MRTHVVVSRVTLRTFIGTHTQTLIIISVFKSLFRVLNSYQLTFTNSHTHSPYLQEYFIAASVPRNAAVTLAKYSRKFKTACGEFIYNFSSFLPSPPHLPWRKCCVGGDFFFVVYTIGSQRKESALQPLAETCQVCGALSSRAFLVAGGPWSRPPSLGANGWPGAARKTLPDGSV